MESKELKDLEQQINTVSDNTQSIECINFLQNHISEVESFAILIFNLKFLNKYNYRINRKKDKLIKEIIGSHPIFLENFLKPIFNISNDSVKSKLYNLKHYKSIIKDGFLSDNKYSYDQIAAILQKIICKPFNFFTKNFVNKDQLLREKLEPLIPELYQSIDDELANLRSIIEKFRKSCFEPIVTHVDSTNPRVSKFGGTLPYLPIHGPPLCPCKKDKLQTVFSLYVGTLPCDIKNLFPKGHEYVVVGYACNSCYNFQCVECYVDDQIDQLVYDDVTSSENVFNEPRTVVEWKENSMLPFSLTDSGFSLPNMNMYSEEELYFLEEILSDDYNSNKNKSRTYLAGYPCFIQGDDSPPNHVLLLEMEKSEASTNLWGDCGTAQVWMKTGEDFGSFIMQYACS